MDKYRDIEEKYKENLDNWLCNLYFSIRRKIKGKTKLPLEIMTNKEKKLKRNKSLLDNYTKDEERKEILEYCNFHLHIQ